MSDAMTDAELVNLLQARLCEDFAGDAARRVLADDAVGVLYRVSTSPHDGLPKAVRHQLLFRAAYVLERVYFDAPEQFRPLADDFCRRAFPECRDASARRCFGKIMADLLDHFTPELPVLDRIAECAADWATDPGSKVAVRVWAVEILKRCREHVAWVSEVWDDVVEAQTRVATPGIASRLRTSWRDGSTSL